MRRFWFAFRFCMPVASDPMNASRAEFGSVHRYERAFRFTAPHLSTSLVSLLSIYKIHRKISPSLWFINVQMLKPLGQIGLFAKLRDSISGDTPIKGTARKVYRA